MAYQDRLQDFPSVSSADYGSVVEVDFDSFEPGFAMELYCSMPVATGKHARHRWTLLVDEPRRLYNAMSFLTWQTGLYFNVHVTLTASSLGFADCKEFLTLMPHWHKELNRCLFDGSRKAARPDRQGGRAHRVSRCDLVRVDHPHYWMGVVEYARDHGVHMHVLCVVPKYAVKAFEEKTWSWWRLKSPGIAQANGIAFRTRHPSSAERRYDRQVELFRYIIKTTGENVVMRGQKDPIYTAREIFKPYPNDCTPVRIEAGQLCGITHRLNEAEQKRAGFVSRYDDGRFEEIYSGWEVGECERREARKRRDMLLETLQI
ncbi:protein of unknown function [Pseudorhizobium banfieldiae]|uniref:Uncharacterized protein n=1 Tax=Pseudorhizobium banfieldiae TaxID=1125847 RepID=L0NCK8_9HYPH|nr:hypothetical protein [Pseudorhizobium banfieldiae]CAD6600184.1 hypothetical protein RNT25_00737 [arsenite-oxidising bacterium NT-25]CCF18057.1 protein of unknown function [Pseudorhizobium banfieldiae]